MYMGKNAITVVVHFRGITSVVWCLVFKDFQAMDSFKQQTTPPPINLLNWGLSVFHLLTFLFQKREQLRASKW